MERATGFELVARAFDGQSPSSEDIVAYIQDAGGVLGLYDLSRLASVDGVNSPKESIPSSVLPLAPPEIPLPSLGANVTKVGRRYRLRFSEWEPGEYVVRLRVGRGGFLESIDDLDESDENVA